VAQHNPTFSASVYYFKSQPCLTMSSTRLTLQKYRQKWTASVECRPGNVVGVRARHFRGTGREYHQIGLRKWNKSFRSIGSTLGTPCRDWNGKYFKENELEADDLCSDSENLLEHKVNYDDVAMFYIRTVSSWAGVFRQKIPLCAFMCEIKTFFISVSSLEKLRENYLCEMLDFLSAFSTVTFWSPPTHIPEKLRREKCCRINAHTTIKVPFHVILLLFLAFLFPQKLSKPIAEVKREAYPEST
jgi:hypothetical protein